MGLATAQAFAEAGAEAFGIEPFEPSVERGRVRAEEHGVRVDLRTGVATTRFRSGGAVHTREVFASHPDQVIVMRIAANRPGQVSFSLRASTPHRWSFTRALGDVHREGNPHIWLHPLNVLVEASNVASGTGSVSLLPCQL